MFYREDHNDPTSTSALLFISTIFPQSGASAVGAATADAATAGAVTVSASSVGAAAAGAATTDIASVVRRQREQQEQQLRRW